ncbi:zinc finger protein 862-like [Saccoglossus kowalevskii]
MVGRKNSVSAKLKDINPFLLNVHCVAHRLALCTNQAASTLDYLKEYKNILTNLFYYFKASSLRSSRLREVEIMLESPQLKIKEIHEIRWFAFYDALQTVYCSWNALVTFFDAQNKSKDPKAVGLYDKLTQYKFVAVTHILMDIISIVTRLNLVFQKDEIDIAAVKPCVRATIEQLKQYKEGNVKGFYTTKFQDEVKVSDDGSLQTSLMGHNLKNRSKQIGVVNNVKNEFINNYIPYI